MKGADEEFESEFIDEEDAEFTPASLKRLREKLKKAVQEKQEYLDGWQRARADFANYKKEEATLHHDREERLRARFVEEMLPALDTLELAIDHKSEGEHILQMIMQKLLESLKNMGIERLGKEQVGAAYNPHIHEALAMDGTEHIVKEVKRSGYKINNHIIRAAQVII